MNQTIIDDMPELYAKLKPYIDYMESMGIKNTEDLSYFKPHDRSNYDYFNGWRYCREKEDKYGDYLVDLASYTHEPKIEVYIYKIKKNKRRAKEKDFPYDFINENYDGVYESKIVDNLDDFKKEIGKYFKNIKKLKEKERIYEMEKDFK